MDLLDLPVDRRLIAKIGEGFEACQLPIAPAPAASKWNLTQ